VGSRVRLRIGAAAPNVTIPLTTNPDFEYKENEKSSRSRNYTLDRQSYPSVIPSVYIDILGVIFAYKNAHGTITYKVQ
jgi:hypothetical protein